MNDEIGDARPGVVLEVDGDAGIAFAADCRSAEPPGELRLEFQDKSPYRRVFPVEQVDCRLRKLGQTGRLRFRLSKGRQMVSDVWVSQPGAEVYLSVR
jgi:hypothetical protein